ncbi:MAG: heparinase II/III family protein [Maritimibacter sp.]|nr:heparinase II/III family protein [Maritimibacter sp.]
MPRRVTWSERKARWQNRWHARRAARARPPTGFVAQPEPRTIGRLVKGRQLVAGKVLLAGHLVDLRERSVWDIAAPTPTFAEQLHGFGWMDDLAALGDRAARDTAQEWTYEWIERYAGGSGVGWTPDLAGRRIIRWINHSALLLDGQNRSNSEAFTLSLAQQTLFLGKRWSAAAPGLPRVEALTGLIYAGLSLNGMDGMIDQAAAGLGRECDAQVDAGGGVATRSPEDLLEVFTLLNWAALALAETGRNVRPALAAAIERIAPTLRALRHADGGLARFHGGGRGAEGRLDLALAMSGIKATAGAGLAMGYARLHGGRTSLVMDAALPPQGAASRNAHASTLALEVTSGRRPLIVNCGSGAEFGGTWQKAGRATPSHSVLGIDGVSSSLLRRGAQAQLAGGPREVHAQALAGEGLTGVVAGHDGYAASHGLSYLRRIEMATDGRMIFGEETLAAVSDAEQAQFRAALAGFGNGREGIPFSLRFHLHPDVDASVDMGGTAVSLALKSGEIWVLRYEGRFRLSLSASVYLEKGRLEPRAAKQVVLSGVAIDYATRIRWSLAKAQDTPVGLRDLVMDEPGGLADES